MPRRCALAVAVVLAVVVVPVRAADAHAIVRETTPVIDSTVPTSPARVVMRFNEPVEVAFGAIRVYDTDSRRVDTGSARHLGNRETVAVDLDPGLPNGTYTVTWRVVSADGHPIDEAFVFHVGAPGERPEGIASELLSGETRAGRLEGALAGIARWLVFASLLVLIGATAFAVRAGIDVGRVVVVAWVGTGVGTVAAFILQGAVAGDLTVVDALSPEVLGDVAGTRFGQVALARLGMLAALALLRRVQPVAVVACVALAATPGLAGHAGTTSPVALNVIADTVHVLAAGAWVGGLVVLLVSREARAQVPRFSELAVASVAALVATGLVRSFVEVRSVDALTETYGLVLLGKVALFVPLVAFGWVNRRRLRPRLVGAEVALAVAVLVATAVLVNLAPARVTAGVDGPFATEAQLGVYRLDVLVDPARVGENAVHLTALTAAGAAAPIEHMQVLFRMPAQGIGPLVGEGVRLAPGHFVVQGRQVAVPGRWVLEIVARTGRFDEARVQVAVTFD